MRRLMDLLCDAELGGLAAYGTSEGVKKEWDSRGRRGKSSGVHKFTTTASPYLGLEPNSEYEVVKTKHNASIGTKMFSTTTVRNTKSGKTHQIPTGNAQALGYLKI